MRSKQKKQIYFYFSEPRVIKACAAGLKLKTKTYQRSLTRRYSPLILLRRDHAWSPQNQQTPPP